MKLKIFVLSGLMCHLLGIFVFAQNQDKYVFSGKAERPIDVMQKCLNLKHGVMMRCIEKGMDALDKDTEDLTRMVKVDEVTQWQAPDEYNEKENPFPFNKENILKGKNLFSFHCSSCHGGDGKGKGAVSHYIQMRGADLTNFRLMDKTDGALFWKITEGNWPMPAFWEGDVLSEEELWHLIHFVRSLSRGEESE